MEKLVLTLMLILSLSSEAHFVSETMKITRIHFYLHDIIGGDSPTVWRVADSNLTDVLTSAFGMVLVLDNPVTSGPELDSGEFGRMQGTVALADLREQALAMVLNLVFTKGEFEGSTLSILGRNPLGAELREVSIVGGTGAFRMATGYVMITTYYNDPAMVRNVYDYTLVVYHMDSNFVY
ncbi:hypothetical protein SASPL_138284 [Salvia splendens]|uniref:Dirigent protein n=1 Tax=Salvia splendens TaxID=180675 RepID=A0A8X8ZDR6_SALSN|nr:dirigent protein 11-like [Salvia splendens]KAG6401427.1 hypothetical protein SASPL_138284 [Salvia splendens]